MGRTPLNLTQPVVKQIWENVKLHKALLILDIQDEQAHCAVLNDDGTCTQLRVLVPINKFKFYSNRGLALVGVRPGKLPKLGAEPGEYNTRSKNMGAK